MSTTESDVMNENTEIPAAAAPESPASTPEEAPPAAPVLDVQPVALAELGDDVAAAGAEMVHDIGLLADIEVELAVELGRSRLPMRKLLSLTPGALVELDRPAGTPVDILVNGIKIARGEVVVVDGDFGVRVTEIVPRG